MRSRETEAGEMPALELLVKLSPESRRSLKNLLSMEEAVGLIWGVSNPVKHDVYKAYKKHQKVGPWWAKKTPEP